MNKNYDISFNTQVQRYDVRLAGVLVYSDITKSACEHFVAFKQAKAASGEVLDVKVGDAGSPESRILVV